MSLDRELLFKNNIRENKRCILEGLLIHIKTSYFYFDQVVYFFYFLKVSC